MFRSGSRSDANNYHPLSILPAFSKTFEKLITNRLIRYLECNNLLSEYQHGFRSGHSTESSILHFIHNIYNYLNKNNYAVGAFIDMSKAFDSLSHSILSNKLEHMRVRGIPLQLFKFYLTDYSRFPAIKLTHISKTYIKVYRRDPS